ncbi:MAG: ComEC/Rec2 family competence protein, partial [Bacillota bacterium]|nr:ComEC/Rec2 family competence protein [Bacillota bacterium]
ECFGFNISWNNKTNTVIIETNTDRLMKVHFLDVGQGDSIFIQLPNGKTMLIDGGNLENGTQIVNYLKNNGVKRLDYLIATHPHADHIGGLEKVVREIGAENYYMPKVSSNTDTFKRFLQAVSDSGKTINTAKAGVVVFDGENLKGEFVAPNSQEYSDLNNYSAVLLLTYDKKRFLFAGDAQAKSENEIKTNISADVLKVGHHGSDTSTTEKFLQKVKPTYAIISVGKDNEYGFPKDETLSRLKRYGCKVYRTDESGTIVVSTNGKVVTVSTN